MMRRALCLVVFLAWSAPAEAQVNPWRTPAAYSPSDVDVLLGCQAVLHAADMFTTAYDLRLGGPEAVREANPLLAPFAGSPVTLTIVSGAIDILEAYTVKKLERRHRKIARGYALALVALEVWTTINNVNAAGELQRQRARGAPRPR